MAKNFGVLFVCTGNSARSQMAEGFARYYGGNLVTADSAGTSPKGIHPHTIWAMNEAGIDISGQTSDRLDTKDLNHFDCIITLCGDARDSCPRIPPGVEHEHWSLPDPAAVRGNPEDVARAFRVVRFQIERSVRKLLERKLKAAGSAA